MSKPCDVLTVVETVYHLSPGEQPKSFETRFSRDLETVEQCYERHLLAKEIPTELYFGWLNSVGTFVIRNKEGINPQQVVSEEEKEQLKRKVLVVSYGNGPGWLVPPLESVRLTPSTLEGIFVRSLSGDIPFTLFAVPN